MAKFYSAAIVVVMFVALPTAAQAAVLLLSPASGAYVVGAAFPVSVVVSSTDQAMNAASGVLAFPPDKLEVTSIAKGGSVVGLWVQEPTHSNSTGTVSFEGIVLNPGYTGAAGKLLTVNFKTKAAGSGRITFASGSVLANDGKGTDILSDLGSATFAIGASAPAAAEATTAVARPDAPPAPLVTSSTHPNANAWYAATSARFAWSVPDGVTGVRLLVDKLPRSVPTVEYRPAIREKVVSGVTDGTWYFHARLGNADGWGDIAHVRFQVDTKKPNKFSVIGVHREGAAEPNAVFTFDAADALSGIDHYEVQIDSGSIVRWVDDGGHRFTTPVVAPGTHTLLAKAFDRAGNALADSAEFVIVALASPVITEYPRELRSGESLVVRGTTYPERTVVVRLQREHDEPQTYSLASDRGGKFTFVADQRVSDGRYQLTAEVVDARGTRSLPSEPIAIAVVQPKIARIGADVVRVLTVVVPLMALVVLLFLICWYGWHRFLKLRRIVRSEVIEVESELYDMFERLRDDIREQIKLLESARAQRCLTSAEEKIVKRMRKDLDRAEQYIKKEIKDIEQEIR